MKNDNATKIVLDYFKSHLITSLLFLGLIIIGIIQLKEGDIYSGITVLFKKHYTLTFEQHEYYRWFSASFIHINVKHFMDTVPLLIIASLFVEGILGTLPYLFVLVTSCFFSNALSDYDYMQANVSNPSFGSSNICFALWAASFAICICKAISELRLEKVHIKTNIKKHLEVFCIYLIIGLVGLVHICQATAQHIQFTKAVNSSETVDFSQVPATAHMWGVIFGILTVSLVYLAKLIFSKKETTTTED